MEKKTQISKFIDFEQLGSTVQCQVPVQQGFNLWKVGAGEGGSLKMQMNKH